MIDHNIETSRQYAEAMGYLNNPKEEYQITVNGIVKAFFLTKERAEQWIKFYKNGKIEKMRNL